MLGGCGGDGGSHSRAPSGSGGAPSVDDAFVAELQERTFRWFWDVTPTRNGLTPDRWPTPSFSSIAAVGFALTAYGIGAERGWVTRAQALERTLSTLRFFDTAPQGAQATGVTGYQGFFYHFLDIQTGFRHGDVELSSIDTTLLLGGILFAQSYFDGSSADEREVRTIADRIYGRVQWTWLSPRAPIVGMGWRPEEGFLEADWNQFNEAGLLYVLALGSPTHPVQDGAWNAWTSNFESVWGEHWGQTYAHYQSMLVYEYSHVWIDFRGIRDSFMASKGMDYFENSRRAVLAQRAYATQNPGQFRDYGPEIFGFSACDGPGGIDARIDGVQRHFFGYDARGPGADDDGTLAPMGVGGAVPFAPEVTIAALKEMKRRYGEAVYGRYGFIDSFNPTLNDASVSVDQGRITSGPAGWVNTDYLGIDQGPIVCMIENWRSGLIWNVMRKNAYIRRGLTRAGFSGGWLAG
ncbi:MAG: glucoamylase family protein [Terricaulis silvestris]